MKEIYKEQLTWITGRKGEKIAFKDMPVDLACEILKLIDEYDREHTEPKTISRSRECVEAECNAMCSLIDYEDFKSIFKDNPRMCPNYRKGEGEDEANC